MKARIPNQGAGGNMMKRIQEMQQNMQTLQEELAVAEYSASSGGGAVDVSAAGAYYYHLAVTLLRQIDVDIGIVTDVCDIASFIDPVRSAQAVGLDGTESDGDSVFNYSEIHSLPLRVELESHARLRKFVSRCANKRKKGCKSPCNDLFH